MSEIFHPEQVFLMTATTTASSQLVKSNQEGAVLRVVTPAGSPIVYMQFSDGTTNVNATTSNVAITPGPAEKFSMAPGETTVSFLAASGSVSVNVSLGRGA